MDAKTKEYLKETRGLSDEQLKNTKEIRVKTSSDIYSCTDIHYTGRDLDDILVSVNECAFVYIGNKVYATSEILEIERVEK